MRGRTRTGVQFAALLSLIGPLQAEEAPMPQVVFVCEHGSVKSVIATEWFNRLARERKVGIRAVSRGVAPDDAIPPGVAASLGQDGFEVDGFRPKRLESADVAAAVHIVAIGVESPLFAEAPNPVERWSDIPPASTEYQRSRDAMRKRIEVLLQKISELARGEKQR